MFVVFDSISKGFIFYTIMGIIKLGYILMIKLPVRLMIALFSLLFNRNNKSETYNCVVEFVSE